MELGILVGFSYVVQQCLIFLNCCVTLNYSPAIHAIVEMSFPVYWSVMLCKASGVGVGPCETWGGARCTVQLRCTDCLDEGILGSDFNKCPRSLSPKPHPSCRPVEHVEKGVHAAERKMQIKKRQLRALPRKPHKGHADKLFGPSWCAWLNHVQTTGPSWLWALTALCHLCCSATEEVLRLQQQDADLQLGSVHMVLLERQGEVRKSSSFFWTGGYRTTHPSVQLLGCGSKRVG